MTDWKLLDQLSARDFDKYMEECQGCGEGFGECCACPGMQLKRHQGKPFQAGPPGRYKPDERPCDTEKYEPYCTFVGKCKTTRNEVE